MKLLKSRRHTRLSESRKIIKKLNKHWLLHTYVAQRTLCNYISTDTLKTVITDALKIAVPAGLSEAQKQEALTELNNLFETQLSRGNLGSIVGGQAVNIGAGLIVDKVAHVVSDWAAAQAAKHTSSNTVIEFVRASTLFAIVDSYAARGGVQAVLVTNSFIIAEAAAGLVSDYAGVASSIRSYESEINAVISAAYRTSDKNQRDRLLRTAISAIDTLNALKAAHPILTTLSYL